MAVGDGEEGSAWNRNSELMPEPEPGWPWFFERNTRAGHYLGIPSLSREIVEETYAVVGSSDQFECDSAGPASRLGRGTRLRMRFRLLLLLRTPSLRQGLPLVLKLLPPLTLSLALDMKRQPAPERMPLGFFERIQALTKWVSGTILKRSKRPRVLAGPYSRVKNCKGPSGHTRYNEIPLRRDFVFGGAMLFSVAGSANGNRLIRKVDSSGTLKPAQTPISARNCFHVSSFRCRMSCVAISSRSARLLRLRSWKGWIQSPAISAEGLRAKALS